MPRAPKKCGRLHCQTRVVAQTYCPEHTAEQRAAGTWGRGSTRQSRTEREIVLARDPHCRINGPNCTRISTEDDHITPLSQGGDLHDLANRQGACHNCHAEKSRGEALQARGIKPGKTDPGVQPPHPLTPDTTAF
jgi:5-methylcytosine-specific restriction endonuclease McrA